MNLYQPTITGSLSVSGSINISGSINVVGGGGTITGTASYATNAELLDGLDSTAFTLTSSFAAFTASQNILNGTYATTGSNTFKNPQTINSNLTVTGSITAQTLIVSTINATQSYSSGSNIFGNASSNTQTFTGSVNITGSLTVVTTGTEFQVTSTGVKFGNVIGDAHSITGSVNVSGSAAFLSSVRATSPNITAPSLGSGQGAFFASAANGLYGLYIGTSNDTGNSFIQNTRNDGSATAYNLFIQPSGGNVGIGTTSTVGKLDISTGGNRNVVISNDSTDTGYNIVSLNGSRTKGAYAGIAGGGTGDNNLYLNSGVDIVFQTGASFTQRMRTVNEFTLAGSAGGTGGPTQVIGTTSMVGILFVSIGTQSCAAIFIINAGNPPVLVSQSTSETRFSITSNSGNTANVYVSGTNIELQNNIQATRTFYCQFFGKLS